MEHNTNRSSGSMSATFFKQDAERGSRKRQERRKEKQDVEGEKEAERNIFH
uniref:Uncharacterized protein n=1 Tax=Arundo donax TaxID=35708 RepID=A0A0A9ARK2_ARUDO